MQYITLHIIKTFCKGQRDESHTRRLKHSEKNVIKNKLKKKSRINLVVILKSSHVEKENHFRALALYTAAVMLLRLPPAAVAQKSSQKIACEHQLY